MTAHNPVNPYPGASGKGAEQRFMALALSLGRRGLGRTWPNPAVGAVIVKDGAIVGRGWTQDGGRPHAEIEALRRAGEAARGASLYVTLEPCSHHGKSPPCADAVIAAGISRVVSALEDTNPAVAGQGHARLRAAGIAVDVGSGAEEARRDHAGHIFRFTKGRPHVLLKLAISADGKAAAAGRKPVTITGGPARDRVHLLRAQSDAIMVGIGTVLADDPMLTCRLPGMGRYSPVRVIADSGLRLPLTSRLARSARDVPVWALAGMGAPQQNEFDLLASGVTVLRSPASTDPLDLKDALGLLAAKGITRLMVEGGPTLAAAFIGADLIDEAVLFHSAIVVGPDGIDALDSVVRTVLMERLKLGASEPAGADREDRYARR
ncbi:MAG: bifunctional diaminohydroxyphosphoribosylaminopyrimidine deaminase/5-amino-6-(5-phosphoribosylamino)uracil reductase RibD [Xanthobacteraceae bacterium]